ncbi:MAG: 50S ribosomal protein L13 [Sandaracinaceae bacterium]|nr:50S ribosomal protein L13 [Sandaracinaceae bacterium]MDW8247279.1 50S ribosomal protein L13 [Sandaracinaceae bacterium]
MPLTRLTKSVSAHEVQRKWYVVDATGIPLGRLASRIAMVLRGKHKPTYTPHVDAGDYVIVINADKVVLTGDKLDQKTWDRHSGIPGGFKSEIYRHLLARKPTFVIEKAVKGMLPKNPLGRAMLSKLKVYASPVHPHAAQKPIPLPWGKGGVPIPAPEDK